MSEITIRPATLIDLPAIFELESAVGKYPYSTVVLRQHFDLGSVIWVADVGDKLASYTLGAYNPSTAVAHVIAVMTRPEYRGRGLARTLGERLLAELLRFAPEEFQVVVSPDNSASLALFRSLGFVEAGIEENYYSTEESRVILRKKAPVLSPFDT